VPRTTFELEMLGEEVERRYRKARPDVERLPWGRTDLSGFSEAAILQARRYWTQSALQEYESTPVASAALRALVDAAVPLDLSALFARFPMDELAHAEICARYVAELGGAVAMERDPDKSFIEPSRSLSPLMRAAELVVRYYCVSEAFSAPMIRASRRATTGRLPRAILSLIAKDEAVHGTAGFIFLDWAGEKLSRAEVVYLSRVASGSLQGLRRMCERYARAPEVSAREARALGWLEADAFLPLAEKALRDNIAEPLRARGFEIPPESLSAA
jgi:hypothetical protein